MSKQIWLKDDVYEKLEFLKERIPVSGRKSVNAIIDELIRNYWNPILRKIYIQEQFDELATNLRVRGILDSRGQESLMNCRGVILQQLRDEVRNDVPTRSKK